MGKALASSSEAAELVCDEADDALGFSISKLCFEGPDEQLKLTENTQPALVTVSAAVLAVLTERGITPDFVAGHSLGEYSALIAAGSLKLAAASSPGAQSRALHAGSRSSGRRRHGGASETARG